MSEHYDLCVIGAGTAGYAAADAARRAGRRVVVVTSPGDVGGTCIRRGCMPAKTVLTSTETLRNVEKAQDVGVEPGRIRVDLQAIVDRKSELVEYFVESRLEEFQGFPIRTGIARFVASDAIVVGDERLVAERFVIATGSRIVPPSIAGLERATYFTSDDALDMTEIPRTLAVIGAGPVGCEFAQYFARLGSRVVLIQSENEILRNDDPDLAAAVRTAMQKDGVTMALGTVVERVSPIDGGQRLSLRTHDGMRDRDVERIMLACERRPNVLGLDPAAAGIRIDGDRIVVDATLRTTNPRVYAAGDVLGRRCLVHVAEWAGALAAGNAFADAPRPADLESREVHAVYTQPQIAVAGLTEAQASVRGLAVRVARHPFEDVGKALVADEPEGFIKMLADADGRVVGVGIVGADAIDLIAEAVVLIARGAAIDDVVALPHLHPTMGEIYVRVAEDLAAREPVVT